MENKKSNPRKLFKIIIIILFILLILWSIINAFIYREKTELAKEYNAVIINADSTAIYKEPIIATAKVKEEEKEGIPHYMLDLISLDEEYTIFDFQKEGRKLLDNFNKENKNIIIVGGSGLYIKALLYDYTLEETKPIKVDYSKYTNEQLKELANKIDENNNIHIREIK